MDVIQLSGYTEEEKLGIAQALPRAQAARGARADDARSVAITDDGLRLVIREYTREAGRAQPRAADRRRSAARPRRRSPRGEAEKIRSTRSALREWLGPRRFSRRGPQAHLRPGVATGLAFTAVGGDVLFIEATAYPGKGRLKMTGQLGEVMQESAQAALSWVRSHAVALGARPGVVRGARRPHPRSGGRGAEGRAVGGDHDGDRDRLARHAASRSPTTSA